MTFSFWEWLAGVQTGVIRTTARIPESGGNVNNPREIAEYSRRGLNGKHTPLEGEGEELAPCQDIKGRLWDVLWMLKLAIRRIQAPRPILHFSLRVVPNVPANYSKPNPPRAKLAHLKAVCGPDDDGSPCLTIMLPEED
jgi:hypothetical protein